MIRKWCHPHVDPWVGRCVAAVLVTAGLVGGCDNTDISEAAELPLSGLWSWAYSYGGHTGDTINSLSVGRSYVLELGSARVYREYENSTLILASEYGLSRAPVFNAGDDTLVVIEVPSASRLWRTLGDYPSLAIRSITQDTMILSGLDSEARTHVFVRRSDSADSELRR